MSSIKFLWAWCTLCIVSGREPEGPLHDYTSRRGHTNIKPFDTVDNEAEVIITWPPNSSVLPTSFSIRCDVIVADQQSFIQSNRGSRVCAGVESVSSPLGCDDIFTASLHVHGVPPGHQRLVVWMVEPLSSRIVAWAAPIDITVSETGPYKLGQPLPGMEIFADSHQTVPDGPDLLAWAVDHSSTAVESATAFSPVVSRCTHPLQPGVDLSFLFIAIKSSAKAFAARQAIRETWMHDLIHSEEGRRGEVCACFVIGHVEDQDYAHALQLEQEHYNDLMLGTQVPVRDSYYGLVNKTSLALRWASGEAGPTPAYVMMLDDDVYLRVRELLRALKDSAPRQRFYAGQVWAEQYKRPLRPQRNPRHRNFVRPSEYPLEELPPFAIGPHFLLSGDLARYVGQNVHHLRGVGTLEDVSVALWMLALQVHPHHVSWFSNGRNFDCSPGLVSFADLTPYGIRMAHDSLQHAPPGHGMCHNFTRSTWVKLPKDLSGMAPEDRQQDTSTPSASTPNATAPAGDTPYSPASFSITTAHPIEPEEPPLCLVITSPAPSAVYAGVEVRLEVAVAWSSEGQLQPPPLELLNPQGEEVCMSLDSRPGSGEGWEWCTRLAVNGSVGQWDVGGLAGGTHLLHMHLPRLPTAPLASVLFDTIEPPPTLTAPAADIGGSGDMPPPSRREEGMGSGDRVIRLTVLSPNLDANSQTLIFLTLLLSLPRSHYHLTLLTVSPTTADPRILSSLLHAHIPVLYLDPSPCALPSLLSSLASPSPLPAPCQPPSLPLLLSHLSHTDIVLSANTLGLSSSALLLHLARLSSPRPLSLLDLPNLSPPLDPTLLPPPDALIAPSTFAASHPSIISYTHHWESALNRSMPTTIIPPSALPSSPPTCPPPPDNWSSPAPFIVGYVGRLAPDRSPGLLLLALAEVKKQLLDLDIGQNEGAVAVVVVGDGPLRQSLQETAAAALLWSDGRPLVDWVGSVERGDVARWYGVMDVVVNTKQAETFGIANAEAAAAGVPVIALDRGANRESLGWAGDAITLLPASTTDDMLALPRRIAQEVVHRAHCKSNPDGRRNGRVCPSHRVTAAVPLPLQRPAFVDAYRALMEGMVKDRSEKKQGQEEGMEDRTVAPLIPPGAFPIVGRLTVVVSPGAWYLHPLLATLMPHVFPTMHVRFATVSATDVGRPEALDSGDTQLAGVVDVGVRVVVVGVLEMGQRREWGHSAHDALRTYRQAYKDAVLVLWSGEAWDLEAGLSLLQAQGQAPDLVVQPYLHQQPQGFCVSSPIPRLYVPVLSTAVAELQTYGLPSMLQSLHNRTTAPEETDRRGIAYLYSRCDREDREALVTELRTSHALPILAMGACQGKGVEPVYGRVRGRVSATWHDDAVHHYREARPKFIIAFENTVRPGYVTEKLLLAFLSGGGVPIYRGDPLVSSLFHPDAFIDCSPPVTVPQCADTVAHAYHNHKLYERMRRQTPVANWTALHDLLSWGHPAILPHSHRLVADFQQYMAQAAQQYYQMEL